MKNKLEKFLVCVLVFVYGCMPIIFLLVFFGELFIPTIGKPSLEEINNEFSKYEKTNNTVVVEDWKNFYFGYSTFDLREIVGDDVCITGDWLIVEDKLYYSLYERDKNKQSYCIISSCDFYGNNNNRLFSIELDANYNSELVEVFDNTFYISNIKNVNKETKIEIFYPLEDRQEEIPFNGNAYDYVETLKRSQSKPYTVISESKSEIIIKNELTLQEYVIDENTMLNSPEGESLLKFDYGLIKAFIGKRIFVLAYTMSNSVSFMGAIVYEYDVENNKLIFQNICEISRSYNDIELIELA